jgi:hypothetical protein
MISIRCHWVNHRLNGVTVQSLGMGELISHNKKDCPFEYCCVAVQFQDWETINS